MTGCYRSAFKLCLRQTHRLGRPGTAGPQSTRSIDAWAPWLPVDALVSGTRLHAEGTRLFRSSLRGHKTCAAARAVRGGGSGASVDKCPTCTERIAAALLQCSPESLEDRRGTPVPNSPLVIVGIDPDMGGAVAAIRVTNGISPSSSSSSSSVWEAAALPPNPAAADESLQDEGGLICAMNPELTAALGEVETKVVDNPCVKVKVGKTMRRRPDVDAAVEIASSLEEFAGGAPVVVCIEQPRPQPTNGALSCYAVGLSFGVWCGVMRSRGFAVIPVEPSVWKKDMNLWRTDKDSSRQMALQIFPGSDDLLRRKKDHGRAEAMLIGAWSIWMGGRELIRTLQEPAPP